MLTVCCDDVSVRLLLFMQEFLDLATFFWGNTQKSDNIKLHPVATMMPRMAARSLFLAKKATENVSDMETDQFRIAPSMQAATKRGYCRKRDPSRRSPKVIQRFMAKFQVIANQIANAYAIGTHRDKYRSRAYARMLMTMPVAPTRQNWTNFDNTPNLKSANRFKCRR